MELLAPAGGWEQLRFAIDFGADAVYLSADRFGLRRRAGNLALDEIASAVDYAHERGVAVHAACNAFMHDSDLPLLREYLARLDEARVDALIIGDLGAMRLARAHAPHASLHVSTQASVSNAEAALAWCDMGADRIICAREMSLHEIAAMREVLPRSVEVEAFAHGAMCMAVSGRCLISDYLADRSANRGDCTQPCRWRYALQEETRPGEFFPVEEDGRGTYIMNARDLRMLGHLDEMRRAGIDSVKIEGRNKKAFYVATVVNAYRQVLDGADPAAFMPELDTVSHRPYGTGFYFGSAAQAASSDRYLQLCDWVAEVVAAAADRAALSSSAPARFTVLCRNRFYEGDELEVLSPHRPITRFAARRLRYLAREVHAAATAGEGEPVSAATCAMGVYSLESPVPLRPHDILRVRRVDPSRKNGAPAACSPDRQD